jgi:MFS transporter, FHS family, glucose/mannose:H+ symporter
VTGAGPGRSRGAAAAALHGAFLLSGVVTVVLGPLIPEASARWGRRPSEVGLLFFFQFVSSSAGAAISSRHPRRHIVAGYGSMAVGLVGLALGPFSLALGSAALMGLGLGLSIPATNVVVAAGHPDHRGAALSRLNLVWGLGAVLSPLLFAVLPARAPAEAVLLPLAALAALAALSLAWTLSGDPAPREDARGAAGRSIGSLLGLAAAQLFLAVGTEAAMGGWLVAAVVEQGRVPSLLVGGAFWAAFLLGRAVAPALLARVTEGALHATALVLAGTGVATLIVAESRLLLGLGSVLAGLGLSPVFPLVMSSLTVLVEASRSRLAGAVFAAGGLGGASLPWLLGRLGEAVGSLRLGFVVPLAAIVLMALLLGWQRLTSARVAGIPAAPLGGTQGA